MTKFVIGGAAAALVIGLAPALAQVAPPPGVAPGTSAPPPVVSMPRAATQPHVMIMSNRVMTRDEVTNHVSEMFARLDTNKDGYITKQEIDAAHKRMEGAMGKSGEWQKRMADRGMMMGDRNAIFDRLDTNHDGSISRQEFMAGHGQVREERVMIMRGGPDGAPGAPGEHGMRMHMHAMGGMGFAGRLFDMADTNHDGRVSLAEAQAAALAHFDKADTNHDGKITPDERQQMRVFRMERRGS